MESATIIGGRAELLLIIGWTQRGDRRTRTAEVVADGYDASDKLASGWRQLHENLLVSGL